MYVCMYVHMYILPYIHTHACVHMHACMHMHVHASIHLSINMKCVMLIYFSRTCKYITNHFSYAYMGIYEDYLPPLQMPKPKNYPVNIVAR